jgi:tetratricopeptide (TPR) repeat protein
MIVRKVLVSRCGWGFFIGLAAITASLFPSQVFKYGKASPEKGYLIRSVPFEKQLKKNDYGPACLVMVLNYWNEARSFSQQKIKNNILDSTDQAAYNSEMVLYPRTRGFLSYSFQGDLQMLKEVVGRGIPVIVLTRRGPMISEGNYRVVIGFDEGRDQIVFHDSRLGGRQATASVNFLEDWGPGKKRSQRQWMLAVVPARKPFPFPALQHDPSTSSDLATAYYRRSDFLRARDERQKARESGPFSQYKLAMASLKQGKAVEAEAYALNAISTDGKNAYAHDVLGMAYADQGRIAQALLSLEKAVWLAPEEQFIREHYLQISRRVRRSEQNNPQGAP